MSQDRRLHRALGPGRILVSHPIRHVQTSASGRDQARIQAPFFTKWAASLRHESIDSDDTDLTGDYREDMSQATYTMTFACRPAFIEPIAERIFKRETENRLVALANFLQAA